MRGGGGGGGGDGGREAEEAELARVLSAWFSALEVNLDG